MQFPFGIKSRSRNGTVFYFISPQKGLLKTLSRRKFSKVRYFLKETIEIPSGNYYYLLITLKMSLLGEERIFLQ